LLGNRVLLSARDNAAKHRAELYLCVHAILLKAKPLPRLPASLDPLSSVLSVHNCSVCVLPFAASRLAG
jgi:hypothetical protein